MNLLKLTLSLLFLFSFGVMNAQDDLLNELGTGTTNAKKEISSAAFKGLQVCNMQSTKLNAKGEWYMVVSHRFGDLTDGLTTFLGFDTAYTKIGATYGVTNWLSLGASRQTYHSTYELAAKYKMSNQEDGGFPVTIVGYNTMDITSQKLSDTYPDIKFVNRLAYTTQLLVSRKFNNSFSAEMAPIWVHKNFYDGIADQKNLLLLGAGTRYKLSKRLSLNLEYAARLNLPEGTNSIYHNPASIGLDIETGGHVFQLVFSNCQKMNDVAYLSSATGIAGGKQIFFGFNMYRVF